MNGAFKKFRCPAISGLVEKFRRFAGHQEPVSKACRYPDLSFIVCTEHFAHPLAEGGRTLADVHCHVKHRTLNNSHQLALRLLDLVMKATQYMASRAGVVVLNKLTSLPMAEANCW